jgi:hypothetical protein
MANIWVIYLPLQQIEFFHVDRIPVAIDRQHDRQTHSGFGGGDRNHKGRKHLTLDTLRIEVIGKRDEIEVDRIQHQLDRHQYPHRIAAIDQAINANTEEGGSNEEKGLQLNHEKTIQRWDK